jgi:acetyl-CoA/propionyl-CoA carboxylase biotin carboxyl carrier protein
VTESVLIANRGEIAARLVRGYRALGVRTIAVHSDADAGALHVRLADTAVRLGPAPSRESYLAIDRVLEAAASSGASAVDPGYGFLSENAEFARSVRDAGIAFIGPSAESIELMGDKVAARQAAQRAGVPVVPGSDGVVTSAAHAAGIAEQIGFPIMVKTSFGGGGRGMRLVHTPDELAAALDAAAAESRTAFGRSEVYLERAIERARHVEVQILGDGRGGVIHLGDRDCSVQRRHQKVIEEAPAPFLPDGTRDALRAAAVTLAEAVKYESTGTIEFLYEPVTEQFFFLEMNTRLQVEHPVTELVTGVDLVAERWRIAQGLPPSIAQEDLDIRGHAVEVRINAENPTQHFLPSPGTIGELRLPTAPWVRCDTGVARGDTIPGDYDSMFAKVMAWGPDRDTAITRLVDALGEFAVTGIHSSAAYARAILLTAQFGAGSHDIQSVERDWPAGELLDPKDAEPLENVVPAGSTDTATTRLAEFSTSRGPVAVAVAVAPRAGVAAAAGTRRKRAAGDGTAGLGGPPTAPMNGVVVTADLAPGSIVDKHDVLFVIEAMKMLIPVTATVAGTLASVDVAVGDSVTTGQVLGGFTPAEI